MEQERENQSNKVSFNPESCYHCGLPIKGNFKKDEKNFCCNGCITAYRLISSFGADSYYLNRTSQPEMALNQEPKTYPYESPMFKEQYIYTKANQNTITLYLENIHCPSCIWVIEKVISNLQGIKEISLNYSTQRAKIIWDNNIQPLENIVNTLAKLGYPAIPVEKNDFETRATEKNKSFLLRLVVSFFGMMATMFLAEPLYFSYVKDLDNNSAQILKYLALIISTPIFFFTVKPFFKGMMNSLKFRVFTMDFTITIGSSLIYVYSIWQTIKNTGSIYYDCLNMFLFLIILGRYIESTVQQKVFNKAVISGKSYPKQATVLRNSEEIMIHTEELNIGDTVLVKSGEQVPADGVIIYGQSHLNESVLTGESNPINKGEGDTVLSGSINLEGSFYFKTTKIGAETNFRQIITLVQNIDSSRSHLQTLTDKAANIFIITVLLLAMIIYIINFKTSPEYALLTAISIIVVTCPCALGLATPVAVSLASNRGIKKGILFKKSNSFEKLTTINHIVFDKTGTLTTGKMEVIKIVSLSELSEDMLLETAASLERFSEHPVAWSIVYEFNQRKLELKKAIDFKNTPGKGISGKLDNIEYFIGNKTLMLENNIKFSGYDDICLTGNVIFLANQQKILGYFILKDKVKKEAKEVIALLKSKNIAISLLSGDKKEIAEDVAMQLGIDNVTSEVLPEQKSQYIENLQKQGYKVAMVGDGINDTPAMVQADVGIAICPNNDLASINADIVILNKDFSSLNKTFELSKNTFRTIKENLVISMIYNIIVIPFAAIGYISPLWAAILMPCSSMIVLLNSLRKSGN